jgi:Phytanoyl-CoA dioxygenase (PhyH)
MTVLPAVDIERFMTDGFVALPGAFSRQLAATCVEELWTELPGVDRHDRATWTQPVIRIDGSAAPPLVAAVNTDRLTGAIDQLVGVGRWQPRVGYGTFPVRFPSEVDPGDGGWHMDGSYEVTGQTGHHRYWLNLVSRARALLLLMLFTDVGPSDAPTEIRVGSHLDVARVLPRFGEAGASSPTVTEAAAEALARRPVVKAVGAAGDVFLCHPFLVHRATWPHRGQTPRFLGQPCIYQPTMEECFNYDRPVEAHHSPCELAVRRALAG